MEAEQVGKAASEVLGGLRPPTSKSATTTPEASLQADKRERLAAYRQAVTANLDFYLKSRVPRLYQQACMLSFMPDNPELAHTTLDKRGLFITGPAGTGKTHLATALFRKNLGRTAFLKNGYPELSATWASVPDVLLRLRATFDGEGRESDVTAELANVRLLVLDDLGAEKASEWTALALYTIISRRVNWMRPTIITSNLTLAEIDAADPRLASRLGGMTVLLLRGEDRRLAEPPDAGDTTKGE